MLRMTCQIITGDCIPAMRSLQENSVDLVILDPPYWKVASQSWDYQWRTLQDYAEWYRRVIGEVNRVSRRAVSVYLFGYTRNLVHLHQIMTDAGYELRQEITVDKGLKSTAGRKTSTYRMFPTVTESIWFYVRDSKPYIRKLLKERQAELGLTAKRINELLGVKSNGGGVWSLYTGNNILAQVPTREMWERLQDVLEFSHPYEDVSQIFNIEMGLSNVWSDINFRMKERIHPTQKPEEIIRRIIYASSNPGSTVLDPFFGSGTTGVVGRRMQRDVIGIEVDREMAQKASRRLAQASSLF